MGKKLAPLPYNCYEVLKLCICLEVKNFEGSQELRLFSMISQDLKQSSSSKWDSSQLDHSMYKLSGLSGTQRPLVDDR